MILDIVIKWKYICPNQYISYARKFCSGGWMCIVSQWLLWLLADIWVLFGSPTRDGSPNLISSWYSTHASDPFLSDWNISRWKALSFNFLFYPGVELINNVVLVSVQFSHSVVSDCLWPHGLQHARPPCLSPTPGVYSNSCPSSRWCHPTISSSVVPFSFHLQSFPAMGSFQISQFSASGGQSIGVSASASVLPMNIHD